MIASKEYVMKTLTEENIFPKKNFSQNFLIEEDVARDIVTFLGEIKNKRVLEIGPGLGALTEILLKQGAEVFCYEIDKKMCVHLKKTFSIYPTFHLIERNFLKAKKEELSFSKVISDLPYQETTRILEKVLTEIEDLSIFVFMVQKEVSTRLEAGSHSKNSSPLSCFLEYKGKLQKEKKVLRTSFYPSPHVDSLVYSFFSDPEKKEGKDFLRFLKQCFLLRRKTLVNNFVSKYEKDFLLKILKELQLPENIRPEEMRLEDFLKLYNVLRAI